MSGSLRKGVRAVVMATLLVAVPALAEAAEVNVYSYRKEHLIRPLLESFTAETGIEVNLVSGKADALLERLKSEGARSPADVLLTTDAGRLARAKEAGVLQAVRSDTLKSNVPDSYRDPEGYWFGLSVRARPIIYAIDRVKPDDLSTYEALTAAKWKDRICIRSSNNIYNQSLLASLIAHLGRSETEAWAKSFVANFARSPKGGDRDQIRAVAAGECDLAIANTYYLGRLAASEKEEDRAVASKVAIFWPNQNGRGVHVNVSGAGVTAHAPNRDEAIRLIEFLSSEAAQHLYAELVYEYPVKAGVPLSPVVAAWGPFEADALNLAVLGLHNAEAVKIADRAGWR